MAPASMAGLQSLIPSRWDGGGPVIVHTVEPANRGLFFVFFRQAGESVTMEVRARAAGLGVALALTWLLLSGHFTPLLLAFGAASVILTVWLAVRMEVVDDEGVPVHLLPGLLSYVPYLLGQIVKANVDVLGRVLRPRLAISPTIVEVEMAQRTAAGRVLYANSITLTPGTVSLQTSAERDRIRVHALSRDGAADLARGEMGRRAAAAER